MTTNTSTEDAVEAEDAERVNTAMAALQAGDTRAAESLLLNVVQRSPSNYIYQYEKDGTCFIKFWDNHEFMHYVLWQKKQGAAKSITYIGSAYPRAYFYLGFLHVKTREYDRAVDFLDQGLALEPTNPKFRFEKAQALVGMKRFREALALYDSVNAIGPHVSPHDLAVALRGRGFVLVEMEDLAPAERAFQESLKIEPGNDVACNELRYIAQLRQGGVKGHTQKVVSTAPPANKCAVCGQLFSRGGIIELEGKAVYLCSKCHDKGSKRWWQIWK
jgi:tetratricopeptide (TPR) repeat protein